MVLGYLVRRSGDQSAGEEMAQETFYRAARAFLGWRGGRPSAWLLAIARNVLVDEVRRGKRLVPLSDSLLDDETNSVDAPGYSEDLLSGLSKEHQNLLHLLYIDGFSYEEVATMSGSTAAAMRTAAYRARAAARDLLERASNDAN